MPNKQFNTLLDKAKVINDLSTLNSTLRYYVAVPFYHPNPDAEVARVHIAHYIDKAFQSHKLQTFNPIASLWTPTGYKAELPPPGLTWYEWDLAILAESDVLVLVCTDPGILESVGVALELGYSMALNLDIIQLSTDIIYSAVKNVPPNILQPLAMYYPLDPQ